jgi:hypothetical protein
MLPTTFMGQISKTICKGNYEVRPNHTRGMYHTVGPPHFHHGFTNTPNHLTHTQIWMVQRNRYRFEIQARKNLFIASPPCEFDSVNNVHETFACDQNEQFEYSKAGMMLHLPCVGGVLVGVLNVNA